MQAPGASWGTIIGDGQSCSTRGPWVAIAPGIMILLTVLSLNVLGDGIRDALDPRAQAAGQRASPMLRFVVRRLIAMVAVMFAITVLVFLIFFATPGVDPAAPSPAGTRPRDDRAVRTSSASTSRCRFSTC